MGDARGTGHESQTAADAPSRNWRQRFRENWLTYPHLSRWTIGFMIFVWALMPAFGAVIGVAFLTSASGFVQYLEAIGLTLLFQLPSVGLAFLFRAKAQSAGRQEAVAAVLRKILPPPTPREFRRARVQWLGLLVGGAGAVYGGIRLYAPDDELPLVLLFTGAFLWVLST